MRVFQILRSHLFTIIVFMSSKFEYHVLEHTIRNWNYPMTEKYKSPDTAFMRTNLFSSQEIYKKWMKS